MISLLASNSAIARSRTARMNAGKGLFGELRCLSHTESGTIHSTSSHGGVYTNKKQRAACEPAESDWAN